MAQRQVQGYDSLFDVFWGLRRVALGSCGAFLGPGGIGGIVAIPPLVEPAFRAGQLPTDVLDFVVGKVLCRGPGDDGVLCVGTWAFPFTAVVVLLRTSFVLDVMAHVHVACADQSRR